MDQQILDKIIKQVTDELVPANDKAAALASVGAAAGVTEFVGTAMGDTIGLVIANVDPSLTELMGLGKYKSIGIISDRVGAGPQIYAVDEAVKASNTEVISVELPRDTKGGGGHGCLIYVGADDVSDARRAVEISLGVLPKYFGDVYGNDAGHLEYQYTARASYCLQKALGAPLGRAFGIALGSPAGIGTVIADTVVKAANVEVVGYCSPTKGTSYSNEVILTFTGDSGAVRQALRASIEVGKKLMGSLDGGIEPKSSTTPYI
jgi:microcompartment protein PduB